MNLLPALFVSHGSPMFALEPGTAGPALNALAAALPRPAAILAISPHWEMPIPVVLTNPQPKTIHDFGGFPPPLYRLQYPARGATAVGEQMLALLHDAGVAAQADPHAGIDHGAWVPLMHMYPQADIPVTQLAIQPDITPRAAFALGRLLVPLRAQNVLVMGTGSLTHNLREVRDDATPPEPYIAAFADWIASRLAERDVDALLDYRARAPGAARAHPADDHLMPLFYALGAAGDDWHVERIAGGTTYGVLSMDSFVFRAREV